MMGELTTIRPKEAEFDSTNARQCQTDRGAYLIWVRYPYNALRFPQLYFTVCEKTSDRTSSGTNSI